VLLSSSLWVHGLRTSALMSVELPCNCGEHISLLSTRVLALALVGGTTLRPCAPQAALHCALCLVEGLERLTPTTVSDCAARCCEQANVLDALVEACRKLVSARLTTYNVMSKLEYVLLALDELVDGGTILEIEGSAIAARVSMKSTTSDVPLHEQTPGQAFSSIKEQMQRHFKLPTT